MLNKKNEKRKGKNRFAAAAPAAQRPLNRRYRPVCACAPCHHARNATGHACGSFRDRGQKHRGCAAAKYGWAVRSSSTGADDAALLHGRQAAASFRARPTRYCCPTDFGFTELGWSLAKWRQPRTGRATGSSGNRRCARRVTTRDARCRR